MPWWPWRNTRNVVTAGVEDKRPLHQHQCCGWYRNEEHAEVIFVDKGYATAGAFLQAVQNPKHVESGIEILHARPAPEANLEAMITYRQQVRVSVVDSNGNDVDAQALDGSPWAWGIPWIIFFR
jgi:hypothetical protein